MESREYNRTSEWVVNNVEPRVLEVLPAALIHYPSAFTNAGKLPEKLKEVIEKILANSEEGPSYGDILYRNMKRWADFEADKV